MQIPTDPCTRPRGVFITGTDTGIGKTVASVALLHALRARGLRAVGMKPVASGCESTPDGLRNEDALALQAASHPMPHYTQVNPFAFADPTTPELAAALDMQSISLAPLQHAFAQLSAVSDMVVMEGAGGWLAPWSPTLMQRDLVDALQLPVILVVGLRLGAINHAWLSARAIRADGARLLGWIGNRIDPLQRHPQANLDILERGLDAPCLGVIPHAAGTMPEATDVAWQLDTLLAGHAGA